MSTSLSQNRYKSKPTQITKIVDSSLKGYLKVVSSLEVQAYNQKRVIARLMAKEQRLGVNKHYEEPIAPSFSLYNLLHTTNMACIIPLSLSIGAIVLMLAGKVLLGIALAVALFGIALIPDILDYKRDMKQYEDKMRDFNNATSSDIKRVRHEILVKAEVSQQIKYLKEERNRTISTLEAIYAVGIIHPSYRNLVAVCSFYDYLDKGICTKLTGHGGAYAFYEEELRFRRIETKLDIIIQKLDDIIANQHQLASLIKEGNNTLSRIEQQNNRMEKTLEQIHENTAVTEYNTRCAAQSAAVMESIAIYRVMKYD